jgi:hypothetical protein
MKYTRLIKEGNFAPQNAIWNQKKGDATAYVSNITGDTDGLFVYEIYDNYGKLLVKGYEKTLPLAKKAVFDYFKIA